MTIINFLKSAKKSTNWQHVCLGVYVTSTFRQYTAGGGGGSTSTGRRRLTSTRVDVSKVYPKILDFERYPLWCLVVDDYTDTISALLLTTRTPLGEQFLHNNNNSNNFNI